MPFTTGFRAPSESESGSCPVTKCGDARGRAGDSHEPLTLSSAWKRFSPWVSTFDRPNFLNDCLRRAVVTQACDIGRERRPFIGEFEIHAVCDVEIAVVPRPTGLADWAACSVLNEGYPRDGGFDDG
jgi:hypothetical protein